MPLTWREHPILKPPTVEEMAVMEPEGLLAIHRRYHEAIENADADPFRYVFVLENWKRAKELLTQHDTLLALGGNKGAKTHLGAWLAIQCAANNPNTIFVCFSQNDTTSKLVQQPAVYHYLPAELKRKILGQEEYVSYSKQNGFTGDSFILPNGSRVVFKTYTQYQQNHTILEGMDLGSANPTTINLGVWCDEYLGGPELLETLAYRLGQKNAKALLTFTPIDGYTELIRQFLEGAKTLETKPAELLANRPVPYIQKCVFKDAAVLYLHTKDNPFSGYERVAKEAMATGREADILCRCYGVPTRSIATKFPSFSRELNVVRHEDIPFIRNPEQNPVSQYMVLDPAGRKKWFMTWIAVDPSDTWWVYREWPDVGIGDWAEWRAGKWLEGPGARRDGVVEGVTQYVDLIMQQERDMRESMVLRLIDSRLGANKYQGLAGVSCYIDDLAEAGMSFVPASGTEIDDGIQALQNKMAFNIKKPVDASNRPHFYISDRCENTIRAIQEYTGDDGRDEAWKDPIDTLRYAAVEDVRFIDAAASIVTRTGKGGY